MTRHPQPLAVKRTAHWILLALALVASGCERSPRVSTAGPGVPPEAVLFTDVASGDLLGVLDREFSPERTLGYARARDELYAWEQLTQGALCGVYTEYCVVLGPGDASKEADARGINAEHLWPQSMGADAEPLKSDLHHLFPARQQVNSSRGNLPVRRDPGRTGRGVVPRRREPVPHSERASGGVERARHGAV